ncbi:MAG: molecular chaperone DnaK, partial [Caulobacter sp.]|nr:molecular chaperone DnaK [Caulobacter sp.]
RGVPQVEVTFDIDANGIVNVGAKDKATNKEQSIRIQANGGLSDADIEQMVRDAESHKADDEKRKAVVEAKNHADSLLHSSEKALAEHGDKVPAEDKAAIEAAIADLKGVIDGEDSEAITAKTQALAEASMKLGEAMYKAQAGDGAEAGAGPSAGGSDEGVVDAEFEEVDDDKKSA